MSETDSKDSRIVLVEGDGSISTLEPLIDLDANRTPEERATLMAYLEMVRNHYRRLRLPDDSEPPTETQSQ